MGLLITALLRLVFATSLYPIMIQQWMKIRPHFMIVEHYCPGANLRRDECEPQIEASDFNSP